jgi:DNA-binding GntR family transcriptional regulator
MNQWRIYHEFIMNPARLEVSETSAHQAAYSFMKEEILAMRLRPNARLNANELAARIGTSRTPVREALGRLEHEGLVNRESAGGFRVHAMSLKEIVDVYRVREALEVEAALEALPHMTPTLLDELAATLAAGESLLDPADYAESIVMNRKFHALIVRAAGNAMLQSIMTPIADRVRLVGAMLIQRHSQRPREVLDENKAILEALRTGDPVRVEEAVRNHVRRAREHASNLLARDHGQLFIAPGP